MKKILFLYEENDISTLINESLNGLPIITHSLSIYQPIDNTGYNGVIYYPVPYDIKRFFLLTNLFKTIVLLINRDDPTRYGKIPGKSPPIQYSSVVSHLIVPFDPLELRLLVKNVFDLEV